MTLTQALCWAFCTFSSISLAAQLFICTNHIHTAIAAAVCGSKSKKKQMHFKLIYAKFRCCQLHFHAALSAAAAAVAVAFTLPLAFKLKYNKIIIPNDRSYEWWLAGCLRASDVDCAIWILFFLQQVAINMELSKYTYIRVYSSIHQSVSVKQDFILVVIFIWKKKRIFFNFLFFFFAFSNFALLSQLTLSDVDLSISVVFCIYLYI